MPAYLIVDTEIENADEYEKYKALAKPIAENTVASTACAAAIWTCSKPTCGHRRAW